MVAHDITDELLLFGLGSELLGLFDPHFVLLIVLLGLAILFLLVLLGGFLELGVVLFWRGNFILLILLFLFLLSGNVGVVALGDLIVLRIILIVPPLGLSQV